MPKGYISNHHEELAKYAAKQEVLDCGRFYVTNATGGMTVSDLPIWQLKRGIMNASQKLGAHKLRDRLRAKLEARQAIVN
jgi:hypothetical protein